MCCFVMSCEFYECVAFYALRPVCDFIGVSTNTTNTTTIIMTSPPPLLLQVLLWLVVGCRHAYHHCCQMEDILSLSAFHLTLMPMLVRPEHRQSCSQLYTPCITKPDFRQVSGYLYFNMSSPIMSTVMV